MKVTVNEGYMVDNGKKKFGPGSSLNMDDEEAKRRIAAGIVTQVKEKESVLSAEELIEAIGKAENLDTLAAFLPTGEKRKTVIAAYDAKVADLKAKDK